tara:strand:+ start:20279 stop:20485 length:207 start_codon:yes stop_codon:yes gene_type:complete
MSWFGTICAAIGASIVASNTGITWYGYFFFIASCLAWGYVAIKRKDYSLLSLNIIFLVINCVGLIRYG